MTTHLPQLLAFAALILSATLHAQVGQPPRTPPAGLPPSAAIPTAVVPDPTALKWDADTKDFNAKPGEISAPFTFVVTNVSDHDVLITKLRTSCGCTVAQLPATPYKLEPSAHVSIAVTLDLRGKSGLFVKTVSVESSAGVKTLIVRANLPQAVAGATPGAPVGAPVAPEPERGHGRMALS